MDIALPLNQLHSTSSKTAIYVALAHGTSHFFHLLLPVLYSFLVMDYGWSYASLGLGLSIFFTVSGVGQILSGSIVDRIGARKLLFASLGVFALACVVLATAQSLLQVYCAAALLGLGNCAFHPIDYSILNQRVPQQRLSMAYSIHSIAGFLGWSLAPFLLVPLAELIHWRAAALFAALVVLLIAGWLWRVRDCLLHVTHSDDACGSVKAPRLSITTLKLMTLPVIWACFMFFFFLTISLGAIQNFVITVFEKHFAATTQFAAQALTTYLVFGCVGTLLGGWLPRYLKRPERVISLAMLVGACLMFALAVFHWSANEAVIILAISGIVISSAGPSRDLLVRQIAPANATGKVYGMVYCGLDLGLAVTPIALGFLMDQGAYSALFIVCGATLLFALIAANIATQLSEALLTRGDMLQPSQSQ